MSTTTNKKPKMHNPAHPGEILRDLCLEPLGVTITQAADTLRVTRKHVSSIVNGRAPISPEMAVRLAAVFATEPDLWINLQAQYDPLAGAQGRAPEGEGVGNGQSGLKTKLLAYTPLFV